MYTQLIYEAKRCAGRDFLRWDIINKTLHLKNRAETDEWSLSETPLSLREKVFDILEDQCTYFHICYQHEFDNINNKEYFIKLQNKFKNIQWRNMEAPYHQRNSFLFGKTIKMDI